MSTDGTNAFPAVRNCPQCGYAVQANEKFCSQCGTAVRRTLGDNRLCSRSGGLVGRASLRVDGQDGRGDRRGRAEVIACSRRGGRLALLVGSIAARDRGLHRLGLLLLLHDRTALGFDHM